MASQKKNATLVIDVSDFNGYLARAAKEIDRERELGHQIVHVTINPSHDPTVIAGNHKGSKNRFFNLDSEDKDNPFWETKNFLLAMTSKLMPGATDWFYNKRYLSALADIDDVIKTTDGTEQVRPHIQNECVSENQNLNNSNPETLRSEYQDSLLQKLKNEGITDLTIYGMDAMYCVPSTAVDGLKNGFKVNVKSDLSVSFHSPYGTPTDDQETVRADLIAAIQARIYVIEQEFGIQLPLENIKIDGQRHNFKHAKTATLVIDIECVPATKFGKDESGNPTGEYTQYLTQVDTQIKKDRQQGNQIVHVSIEKSSKYFGGKNRFYSITDEESPEATKTKEATGELISYDTEKDWYYNKRFFSALTDTSDIIAQKNGKEIVRPHIREEVVETQVTDAKLNNSQPVYLKAVSKPEDSLLAKLQAEGITHLSVYGVDANRCLPSTAVDGIKHGLIVDVQTDVSLSVNNQAGVPTSEPSKVKADLINAIQKRIYVIEQEFSIQLPLENITIDGQRHNFKHLQEHGHDEGGNGGKLASKADKNDHSTNTPTQQTSEKTKNEVTGENQTTLADNIYDIQKIIPSPKDGLSARLKAVNANQEQIENAQAQTEVQPEQESETKIGRKPKP